MKMELYEKYFFEGLKLQIKHKYQTKQTLQPNYFITWHFKDVDEF